MTAIVWRLCLAAMVVTCVVAVLSSGTICRWYQVDYLVHGRAEDGVDTGATFVAVDANLKALGFQLEGRVSDMSSWTWDVRRPTVAVRLSSEDDGVHVALVQSPSGRAPKSDQFLRTRRVLKNALTDRFGKHRVEVVGGWW